MKRLLPSLVILLSALWGVGCASPTTDESDETATDQAKVDALSWTAVNLPVTVTEDATAIFGSEDELRAYFGKSCGTFCSTPWDGPLGFKLAEDEVIVFVSRVESAPDTAFSISHVVRNRVKWLTATTCAQTGKGQGFAFARVKGLPGFKPRWVADGGEADTCR